MDNMDILDILYRNIYMTSFWWIAVQTFAIILWKHISLSLIYLWNEHILVPRYLLICNGLTITAFVGSDQKSNIYT